MDTASDFDIAQSILSGIAEQIFEVTHLEKIVIVKYQTVAKWLTKKGYLLDKALTFVSKKVFNHSQQVDIKDEVDSRWNPAHFGDAPRSVEETGQVSVFFDDSIEPPLPEECGSLQEFEQKWGEWEQVQPKISPENPFVMPDETPISTRFKSCDYHVRVFASSRYEGKSQAWIVSASGEAVEGFDNLLNIGDFAECYTKCERLNNPEHAAAPSGVVEISTSKYSNSSPSNSSEVVQMFEQSDLDVKPPQQDVVATEQPTKNPRMFTKGELIDLGFGQAPIFSRGYHCHGEGRVQVWQPSQMAWAREGRYWVVDTLQYVIVACTSFQDKNAWENILEQYHAYKHLVENS